MGIRSLLLAALFGLAVVVALGTPLRADQPNAIFVMKINGSGLRRLAEAQGYLNHGAPRWSHDGQRLVFDAAGAGPSERRWFLINADGSGQAQMGLGASADWSPDDKQLVFAVGEKTPIKQGTWVQNVDGRGRQWLADGGAPRWSPDGSEIATFNGNVLKILDLIESQQRKLLEMPAEIMAGFDWSPDGTQLALVTHGGGQKELWLVDASDAEKKQKLLAGDLDGHVAWSPDGKQLAIALDHRIHLLALDRGAPQPIAGQEGDNSNPAWSYDGQWIAFASDRKTPALVPVSREKRKLRLEEVKRHTRGNVVYWLTLSPDGRKAYLGGKRELEVWDMVEDETSRFDVRGELVELSPDGRTLALSGPLVKIKLRNLDTGKPIRDLHTGVMCNSISFSPDGKRLVSGLINNQAVVWDVASGKRICTFKKHETPVTRVAFLPSGEEAASNGQDKMLRIWNARTAEERLAIPHPDVVWGLAVSPDGRLIATGTGGKTVGNPIIQRIEKGQENVIRLWDAASGKLVREMNGHTNVAYVMKFSPDGRTLVSGGWDGTIRLWDIASGEQLASAAGQGSVYAVAFTPSGREVIVAGGENRFANTPIQRFRDEQVRVYRVVEADAAAQSNPQ